MTIDSDRAFGVCVAEIYEGHLKVAAEALTARFGPGPVDGKIQAKIVAVMR
jgi:hypothetical protein